LPQLWWEIRNLLRFNDFGVMSRWAEKLEIGSITSVVKPTPSFHLVQSFVIKN
jgi:hypothetical protein